MSTIRTLSSRLVSPSYMVNLYLSDLHYSNEYLQPLYFDLSFDFVLFV